MPAAEVNPVDKASLPDREPQAHRRPGSPQFLSAVTFGLGVAALAGVVVTAGPVTRATASVRAVSVPAAATVALDPVINLMTSCHNSCTGEN